MRSPSWFKMFASHRELIEALSDENAGCLLKAAMTYFCTNQVVDMNDTVSLAFLVLKKDIDKCVEDYNKKLDAAAEARRKRQAEKEAKPQQEKIEEPHEETFEEKKKRLMSELSNT